ncbi:MAG: periplasmic heavy metal sensor [Sulfitobacter sp.]
MSKDDTTPRTTGRGIKWALGLSLAVNLIVVGLIAGALWRFQGGGPRAWDGPPLSYGAPFARALPRDDRRALNRKLRREEIGLPSRAERRALYQEMVDLLRSETFDAARVQRILDTQASTAARVQTHAQKGWVELVSAMTLEERRAMAFRLEEALRRGHKKRKPRE